MKNINEMNVEFYEKNKKSYLTISEIVSLFLEKHKNDGYDEIYIFKSIENYLRRGKDKYNHFYINYNYRKILVFELNDIENKFFKEYSPSKKKKQTDVQLEQTDLDGSKIIDIRNKEYIDTYEACLIFNYNDTSQTRKTLISKNVRFKVDFKCKLWNVSDILNNFSFTSFTYNICDYYNFKNKFNSNAQQTRKIRKYKSQHFTSVKSEKIPSGMSVENFISFENHPNFIKKDIIDDIQLDIDYAKIGNKIITSILNDDEKTANEYFENFKKYIRSRKETELAKEKLMGL